ncbi:MAG TPA: hypothetical protein VGQ17_18060 [Gemmatimonadales bacterium]|jgi:hypothetical protein|nr:hypothetical protein [Gemmatimonadales bacterium]
MIRLRIAIPGLFLAVALLAQAPEADSAAVARDAWRQAVPLARAREWLPARELVRRAFQAWPQQQVYVYGYAALSARVGDTAESARALTQLADMGLARDLAADESFATLRDLPAFRDLARRFAANAAPLARNARRDAPHARFLSRGDLPRPRDRRVVPRQRPAPQGRAGPPGRLQ